MNTENVVELNPSCVVVPAVVMYTQLLPLTEVQAPFECGVGVAAALEVNLPTPCISITVGVLPNPCVIVCVPDAVGQLATPTVAVF